MLRRTFITAMLLLVGFTARVHAQNVVLVVADDQGLDAGCYGHPVLKTPHLDALAAAGTRFNYAFCTTSSCSASRSVILSGLHNHANGMYGLEHAEHHFHSQDWIEGLPVLLSQAGYRSCSIGKYHVVPESAYHFDAYPNRGVVSGRSPVAMAERAKEFIEEDDTRPFFVYLCSTDPHRAKVGFANDRSYEGVEPTKYNPAEAVVPYFLPDKPEVREELAEYYESISRLDTGLGRLMEVLHETGHWDDTLILYISDNGMPWPGAKTTLYEPGMHLPLVVRKPGQKPGLTCNAMVSFVDLAPTILDYAGAEGPKYQLHGRSFLPVIEESDPKGWDQVYGSHTFHEVTMYYPMRALRTRQHKLILNLAWQLPFPFASDLWNSRTWQGVLERGDAMYGTRSVEAYVQRPRLELYDLKADPKERENLAEKPEQAELVARLADQLRGWQRSTKDPWYIKYEHE